MSSASRSRGFDTRKPTSGWTVLKKLIEVLIFLEDFYFNPNSLKHIAHVDPLQEISSVLVCVFNWLIPTFSFTIVVKEG